MTSAFLDMKKLGVQITTPQGKAWILRDLDLTLSPGERLGIVGESGSGKSMLALAIMRLLPDAARLSGQLLFDGQDLISLGDEALCRIRGPRIAMVFQEPMTALNPVQPIGDQVAEGPRLHFGLSRREASARAETYLAKVGLPQDQVSPATFPHQLSGGQRQRVMIAMTLALEPDLLIADEPTTALDVTVQTNILELIKKLTDEARAALIMISHDFGVIAKTTSRVAVMYAGRIVEEGPTGRLLRRMAHPYTKGLHAAMPQHALASSLPASKRARLKTIPGAVPSIFETSSGCAFASRCSQARAICSETLPGIDHLTPDHKIACHHPLAPRSTMEVVP